MVFKKDTILYFTGSGNSLQVAKDIGQKLESIDLYEMSPLIKEQAIEIESNTLGLIFPVYYSRLPLIVEKIIKKLKISKDTYVFAVVTYGGAPAEVLLKLKYLLESGGNFLHSGFLLRMPANHIFAYNPYSPDKCSKIYNKENKKINEIYPILLDRKNHKCSTSKLLIDTLIDHVFISVTDKIMNNFHITDEKFWVTVGCNGCRLCEKICPVNNIEYSSDRPVWKHHCEHCTACIQYCPTQAIQWGMITLKRNRYRNPNIKVTELIKR